MKSLQMSNLKENIYMKISKADKIIEEYLRRYQYNYRNYRQMSSEISTDF